jgi:hypothetical protein
MKWPVLDLSRIRITFSQDDFGETQLDSHLNVPYGKTWGTACGGDPGISVISKYVDLRERNHSFEDLAAFNLAFVALDTGGNPSVASGFAVLRESERRVCGSDSDNE